MVAHDSNLAPGRQRQEFEASLVYRVTSRTARVVKRDPVSNNNNTVLGTQLRAQYSAGTQGPGLIPGTQEWQHYDRHIIFFALTGAEGWRWLPTAHPPATS
ncbi:hypothetical protein LEMLEM_LOCUS25607 [Lemmus lemmus]